MSDPPLHRAFMALLDATVGEDPDRDGLIETPGRAARAWTELTGGYAVDVPALLKTFALEDADEMVVVTGIPFASLCEHHLLPFTGHAHVAYIPDGHRVVGLSKIPRLVDAFARRLQIQERMTQQIAGALWDNLTPVGVMVVVEAEHTCAALRGVKKNGMTLRTSALRGALRDRPEARAEALALLRLEGTP